MTEEEIRGKISPMRVDPYEFKLKVSEPKKGDIVWIHENDGGRSWCVEWRMPTIVLDSEVMSNGSTVYCVCYICTNFGSVGYRLVEAHEMRCPPEGAALRH